MSAQKPMISPYEVNELTRLTIKSQAPKQNFREEF